MKFCKSSLCLGMIFMLLFTSCKGKPNITSSSSKVTSNSSSVSGKSSGTVESSKNSSSSIIKGSSSSKPLTSASKDNTSIDITYDKKLTVVLKTRVINVIDNKQVHKEAEATGLFTELAPWVQTINGKVKALISTAWCGTLDFNPNKNFSSTENIFDKNSKMNLTTSAIHNFGSPTWNLTEIDNTPYWRRNYYGAFNMFTVKSSGKEYLIGVMHGENKNERFDGASIPKFNNTVFPKDRQYKPEEYDGTGPDGIYKESSGTYFAFSGITVAPTAVNDGAGLMNGDKGPVIWPSAGYLDDRGEQASQGIRHSSGFVTDDYLYVYYLDTSISGYEIGRSAGLKVARSPISSLGEPGSFRNYFGGKWEEKSLPDNFNKNSRDMFYKQGGKGSVILTAGSVVRFSVAKVKGTSYYLGVEETFTSNGVSIMLRASTDLANWGDPVTIKNASQYLDADLHYPVFYNKNFTSSIEIDKDEFYVGGMYGCGTPNHYFQYVKLSVDITEK